jgi:hypothetical protein
MHEDELRRIILGRIAEDHDRAAARHRRRRGRARRAQVGPRRVRRLGTSAMTVLAVIRRLAVAGARGVGRVWRVNVEVQERLYDAQHPWELEGPLRWQGRGSNARLIGCDLPIPSADDLRDGRTPGAA